MTIEQIQALITAKGDLREIVNELADYIQSNPSSPGGSSYLVYVAVLTQSGTNAPVATVFENTLGGTVVFGYDDIGTYRATLSGAFPLNKTFINVNNPGFYIVGGGRNDTNSCYISSWLNDGTPANDIFIETAVEIRVYP